VPQLVRNGGLDLVCREQRQDRIVHLHHVRLAGAGYAKNTSPEERTTLPPLQLIREPRQQSSPLSFPAGSKSLGTVFAHHPLRRLMTMSITRAFIVAGAAALATVLGSSQALAQEPPPTRTPVLRIVQSSPVTTLEGELVRVDTMARMIVVKTADGKEEQLAYTDSTKVSGAQKSVAGLANPTPTQVSVLFTGSGSNRVATEITVREAKS